MQKKYFYYFNYTGHKIFVFEDSRNFEVSEQLHYRILDENIYVKVILLKLRSIFSQFFIVKVIDIFVYVLVCLC